MADDIVERLREWIRCYFELPDDKATLQEAADLIDRQREEIVRLKEALDSIRQFGSDTLSGRSPDDGPDDREWQRDAVLEMTRRARSALSDTREKE